ncbi:unnamed protein product [Blepharisma stoltei]|uniref:PA14 domain-containing protein n=1 Tax=Blepharisma stoltei TaxID=1481888 RepID=A0AAU9JEN8_9CILI|nr:unnamed protein product [Blepharisma stoltei]
MILLFFFTILGISKASSPSPITWSSYDRTNNIIEFTWSAYSGSSPKYQVMYDYQGKTYFLPMTSKTQGQIKCSTNDGSSLKAYYYAIEGGQNSENSTSVTLLCAGTPADVNSLTYTHKLKQVTLLWDAAGIDNGGSAIIGYSINRKSDVWELIASITDPTITNYTDTVEYGISYIYIVQSYNSVGSSPGSLYITVFLTQVADPAVSTISVSKNPVSQSSLSVTVNLLDSGGNVVINPAILLLEVRDVCSVNYGYECIRVNSTDPNYVSDLLEKPAYVVFSDNTDGTMTASYTPILPGPYTMSVLQLTEYGILGDYWQNIWFYQSPTMEREDSYLNMSWPLGTLITPDASNFITIKWFGFLLADYSEEYTIYLFSDDFARLYIDNDLMIDNWSNAVKNSSVNYTFTKGVYTYIQLEFKQIEGSANIWLGWSSQSQASETIPSNAFYYPIRVNGSPWLQEIGIGTSSPQYCYFEAENTVNAGITNKISIYSADADGNLLDNTNDVYSVSFSGPATLNFQSVYSGNGKSIANYILTTSGTYTLKITLYGSQIKNSPISVTVNPGPISIDNSYTDFSSIISSTLTAGDKYISTFVAIDAYLNTITSSNDILDLQITFVDNNDYTSSIGVAQPSNWTEVYGENYSGTYNYPDITFQIFRAGNYQANIYINQGLMKDFPMNLKVQPNSLNVEHSAIQFSSYQGYAGTVFSVYFQARDVYYNNLLITSVSSYQIQAIGASTVTATFINYSPGVFTISFTITKSGVYSISGTINGSSLPSSSTFTILPALTSSSSTTTLSGIPTQIFAGNQTTGTITSKDQYSNIRIDSSDTFTATITGLTGAAISPTLVNNGNGIYSLIFTPKTVDTYTVKVYLNSAEISGSSVKFTTIHSQVCASAATISSYSSTSTVASFTLYISSYDLYGNLISNISSIDTSSQYFYGRITGVQNIDKIATINDNKFYLDLSFLTQSGAYSLVLLWYQAKQDTLDFLAENLYYNFDGINSQCYQADYKLLTNYGFQLVPASTDPSSCKIYQYSGDSLPINQAEAGIEKMITIEARDKYGNIQVTTTDVFSASLVMDSTTVTVTIQNQSAGYYTLSFLPQIAGIYNMTIYLQVNSVESLVTSISIKVIAGITDPTKTQIIGLSSCTAGGQGSIYILTYDTYGNFEVSSNDVVSISMSGTSTVSSSQISIKNYHNEYYIANYIIYLTGTYTVSATIDSEDTGKTFQITITPALLSMSLSQLAAPSTATSGSTILVDLYLKDLYNNAYTSSPIWDVYLDKEDNPNFSPLEFTVTAIDSSSGQYSASAVYDTSKLDLNSFCGSSSTSASYLCDFKTNLQLYAYTLVQGLNGLYYSNSDFEEPISENVIDGNIDFDWGSSSDISVIWDGALVSSSDTYYTFYLNASDWASLSFNNEVVIDTNQQSSYSASLKANQVVEIQIKYYNVEGDSYIHFQWESSSITKTTVPSSVLYHYYEDIPVGSGAAIIQGS